MHMEPDGKYASLTALQKECELETKVMGRGEEKKDISKSYNLGEQ